MLEPTKEMCEAGWDELPVTVRQSGEVDLDDMKAVLTVVLDLVERDNQVHPLCTATLGTDMRCEFEAGMAHPNEHSAKAPSGSRVRWS